MNNILVTGIGGNVGYGILRNIRHSFSDIRLIGTNTSYLSAGNHFCDEVYEVPFSTDNTYMPVMIELCAKHNIDLIIPSTDYETYILAVHADKLPPIAVSPSGTTKIFLDKYLSYQALSSFGLAFAESILPSAYDNRFEKYILKPREGRGSRNLFYNPSNPERFSDDYIVQPMLEGIEITTAFYVTMQNELHGLITLERQLASGATNICEVNQAHDKELEQYIRTLISKIEIRGACNLQSIVTADGTIVPFEVNCRISGTNSIRSQFGFKDVSYTVDEYLYNKQPEKPVITTGSAVRMLSDIIYHGTSLKDITNNADKFYIYE